MRCVTILSSWDANKDWALQVCVVQCAIDRSNTNRSMLVWKRDISTGEDFIVRARARLVAEKMARMLGLPFIEDIHGWWISLDPFRRAAILASLRAEEEDPS